MTLSGKVTSVIEPESHQRGKFSVISARFDAHVEAKENPYVISFHAEPGAVKEGDTVTVSFGAA
jgi:hypothetical protein